MAPLINSIWALRSKSHLETRLNIRDERTYATRLIPWLALVMLSFSVVDWLTRPEVPFLVFFAIRLAGVAGSRILYLWSRGRVRYGTRLFLTVAPYIGSVEFIMLWQDLARGPYFAGLGLVMITSAMLFPVRFNVAAAVYTTSILPILVWCAVQHDVLSVEVMTLLLMVLGSVAVCSVNSGQVREDHKQRLRTAETLARDLGKRDKEIREKAEELVKRQTFESQFSPQVVSAVLNKGSFATSMRQMDLAVIVIDIENSTGKTSSLKPLDYKAVVEEVFDVFSSACLKWNVTVDKFTGDGAQAFAGAPIASSDNLFRATRACVDTIQMLKSRGSNLETLWGGPLNIRFAVCCGPSLVGFLGRGTLKSYTAMGETVSLAHRLCAHARPWAISVLDRGRTIERSEFDTVSGASFEQIEMTNFKGFGAQKFRVLTLSPQVEEAKMELAQRCRACGTPLVFEETATGMPKVVCPGCVSRHGQNVGGARVSAA